DYFLISTSFEGLSDEAFKSELILVPKILELFADEFEFTDKDIADYLRKSSNDIRTYKELALFLSKWILKLNKKVVLIIDEVDKASNNQAFISFLAMLRDQYLRAKRKKIPVFHSVVLIGVHDVKSLKLKIRDDDEKKLNSSWNIAGDFNIPFTFNLKEIEVMLADYAKEHNFNMNISLLSLKIFYYSSGHPFLVSKICHIIDEVFMHKEKRSWVIDDINKAYKYITDLGYTTTNFDDMYKNLENNDDLRNVIYKIIIEGDIFPFDIGDPVIAKDKTFGLLTQNKNGKCDISNKIYEFRIFNYFISKNKTMEVQLGVYSSDKFTEGGNLNVSMILEKFQLFMKEHNSSKDNQFLEKNGRLLLMSFLRPIVNGHGFLIKENVGAEDRKMDLVITFNNKRYVIELKIWYGKKYLTDGIEQLCDYLDSYNLNSGHILIYNFNKNKQYEIKTIDNCRKNITAVFV
ncbi:MAG: AAA family ATPase, partial [Bacteroidota bacterium]|nr:AAA family ATPase [Bacteroidota bacterium]